MFVCLSTFLSNQKETESGQQKRCPAQRSDRDVWIWRRRKLAEADKKQWRVGRRRGRSLCSVRWASSCCNFYLLAQSYLEYLACLALWVANFSAFHTDLSSGSPGAEGCSGNSQRSFSSETQKHRQRVKDKGEWHASGCWLLVCWVQTDGLEQAAATAGCVCTSGSKTAPLYTGLAVVRLFLSCRLLWISAIRKTPKVFGVFSWSFFYLFIFLKTLFSNSNKLSPSKCSCVTRPRDTMKASFCRRTTVYNMRLAVFVLHTQLFLDRKLNCYSSIALLIYSFNTLKQK